MLKLLVIVAVIVTLAFILLGINILFFKRKFPETEIGRNKDMIKLGLVCPQCEEKRNYRRSKKPVKLNPVRLKPDWGDIQTRS